MQNGSYSDEGSVLGNFLRRLVKGGAGGGGGGGGGGGEAAEVAAQAPRRLKMVAPSRFA